MFELCLILRRDKGYTQTLIAQYLLSTWDKIGITSTKQLQPGDKKKLHH